MPPAIIAGVVGAAGAIGGALISSKANSKAINTATQAQQRSEDAQLGFQREARAENTAALSPFMARGNAAGETINAALGLGYSPAYAAQVGPAGSDPAASAASAYEMFKKSTGYETRFNEGNRSLSANYFGGGVGQSGAAMKAALRYGQGFASNEFGNWLGALGGQQQIGFGGASALAGVSQTFADRASGISQGGADMAAQAAVARARNQGALWTGIAGTLGQTAGSLSSYRPPANYNYAALAPDVNRTIAANPALF